MENNENNENNTPGKRIKHARKLLGLTQEDLAKSVNMSRKTISDVEKGGINPNINLLTNLRKVWHVSLDYITLGKGETFLKKDVGVIEHEEILKNVEVKGFLDYFLNSKIVQLKVLEFFKNLHYREYNAINKEMGEKKK